MQRARSEFFAHSGLRSIIVYLRTMLVVILVWLAVSIWLGRPYLLPGPGSVAGTLLNLLVTGKAVAAVAISGKRLLMAYCIAAGVGIPVGIAMGLNTWIARLFDWLIEMTRPISGIALIPLLLVLFGVGDALPMGVIFYAAVFPFILNSYSGVRQVDARLIDAARVLGAKPARILCNVTIPASIPDIITGARIAITNSWMALIVSELVGTPNGVGFAVGNSQEIGNATLVLAWITIIGLCGYLLDTILERVEVRLTPWRTGLKVGD